MSRWGERWGNRWGGRWGSIGLPPVTVGPYRHAAPAPIKRQRPERLSTLERRFKRWERKP